ncbi:16892_t:CDS:2, partial [Acaulospora colombiana]
NKADGNLVDLSVPPTSGGSSGPFGRMTSPFDTTNADIRLSTDRMTSPFDTSVLKRNNSNGTRPKPVRTESDASMKMKARAAQLSSQLENNVSALSKMNIFNVSPLPSPGAAMKSPKREEDDFHLPVYNSPPRTDPNLPYHLQEVHVDLDKTNVELPSPKAVRIQPALLRKSSRKNDSDSEEELPKHKRAPSQRFKAALKEPLAPEGVGRAIVRFDFDAVESDDLTMRKGEIVTILEKSASVDDWWKGKIGDRVGNFPANFVEVVGSGNNANAGMPSLDPFD